MILWARSSFAVKLYASLARDVQRQKEIVLKLLPGLTSMS